MDRNESHMRWAIALALEGHGKTSPNPMVGAVIVRDGKIVGEGFHERAGGDHAEVRAIEEAGKRAKGADLYVTLEPCCHYGKTPPCVDAIIRSGIARVFVGTKDPNPIVSGHGIELLRVAGIDVSVGLLGDSCRRINETYNKFIARGTPFVTAKAAVSLDGKIATCSGRSKWITNEECRIYVHRLRATVDAVAVGRGTAIADDPLLTSRKGGRCARQPKAVLIDEELSLPTKLRLFKRKKGDLIIATTKKAKASRIAAMKKMGHSVVVCRTTRGGTVDLADMLSKLGDIGVTSMLVEGGSRIFSSFVASGLIDRFVICIAPILIGGGGLDFLPEIATRDIKKAYRLADIEMQAMGDNIVIEGRMKRR